MQTVYPLGIPLSFFQTGQTIGSDTVQLIWGHGWMHSHLALFPLAQSMERTCSNLLLDFPGFGESPRPPEVWGTKEYASHIAAWLETIPCKRRIWVGHSFGCRVGIQLAASYPDLLDGLFLIAAPGLPLSRSISTRLKVSIKIYCYKSLKKLMPLRYYKEWLQGKFGSYDYIHAGDLRPIFVKVISEDLTEIAKQVHCPVHLVYGENDTEAPPLIGQRFQQIIPRASFTLLPKYSHNGLLLEGKHQVLHQLNRFMEQAVK